MTPLFCWYWPVASSVREPWHSPSTHRAAVSSTPGPRVTVPPTVVIVPPCFSTSMTGRLHCGIASHHASSSVSMRRTFVRCLSRRPLRDPLPAPLLYAVTSQGLLRTRPTSGTRRLQFRRHTAEDRHQCAWQLRQGATLPGSVRQRSDR